MIRWFARNDVAANFLLVAILFLGLRAAFTQIPLEVRPSYEFREVEVRMDYRGGTPEDVERTIVLPIEQAMEGLPGVKELRSEVRSGSAEIELEPERDADIDKMLIAQRDRLDALLVADRAWPYGYWCEHYLDHPLVGTLARRLIWTFEHGGDLQVGVWYEGQLVGHDDAPLPAMTEGTTVRLWHPVSVGQDDIDAWRAWFEAHEIAQPFKQAHREIYLLTDAE